MAGRGIAPRGPTDVGSNVCRHLLRTIIQIAQRIHGRRPLGLRFVGSLRFDAVKIGLANVTGYVLAVETRQIEPPDIFVASACGLHEIRQILVDQFVGTNLMSYLLDRAIAGD